MASSFITKDSKHGFWIHDSIFQVVSRLIYRVIEKEYINETDSWIGEIQSLLDKNAKGIFHSYMHLNLDKLLSENDRVKKMTNICESTKGHVAQYGQHISSVELGEWFRSGEIGYQWNHPIETDRIVKVIQYLEDVINDKITIQVSDRVDYEF